MKSPLPLLTVCLALASCSTTKPVSEPEEPEPSLRGPTLESRLDPKWYSSAKRISAKNVVIYYKGTADGQVDAAGDWAGTVKGDVLVFLTWRDGSAIVMPKGTIRINGGGLTWEGRTTSYNSDSARWRHLLRKG